MSNEIPRLINSEQFKHLLTPAIYDMSHKIQNSSLEAQNSSGMRYLNIENEALEHIGLLVLNVFNSILLANYNFPTPEAECSIAMSSNSSNPLTESPTISSMSSMTSSDKFISDSNNNFQKKSIKVDPILDLTEAEIRVRRVMPLAYIDPACTKAIQMVEKCKLFMNNSKRNKLFKAINDLQNNILSSTATNFTSHISSSMHVSSNSAELAQQFTFPIDRIHVILSKEIFLNKLDLFVTIYLVNILEFICIDILRLVTYYVRILGKYNINKSDVTTAIQADPMLTKVFYSNNVDINYAEEEEQGQRQAKFEFNNPDDDAEDEVLFDDIDCMAIDKKTRNIHLENKNKYYYENEKNDQGLLNFNERQTKASGENIENVIMSTKLKDLKSHVPNGSNSSNNEDVTSDSSTICAESISFEHLNLKYSLKVRELIQEQNQYLNDLNVIRRIFMYSFKKCCYLFSIKLNEENESIQNQNYSDQIENIFGNINDLYDCALRLADLLDDVTSNLNSSTLPSPSQFEQLNLLKSTQTSNTRQAQQPQIMVGQQFWELAEGDEFSIYTRYAECVTNFNHVKTCITCILNNPKAYHLLQQTSPGLIEISKYLLPKLLMSSIYHLLYISETVEFLQQHATDEDDKALLNDTLDTLKSTKYKLAELGFTDSHNRPIETSFRMFQAHQFLQQSDKFQSSGNSNLSSLSSIKGLSNSTVSGLNNLSQKKVYNITYNTTQALVSNISMLTHRKLNEIETKVESFKLPGNISPPIVHISSNSLNSSTSDHYQVSNQSESNVRSPYLYEGSLSICRTSQPIQNGSTKISAFISSQTKLKISKRYAYLFDGFIVLVKKMPTNYLSSNNKCTSRFKQAISLDKCYLKDHDDDCSFELQIFNNNSVSSSTLAFYTQQQQQQQQNGNNSKSNNFVNNYQDQEFIIFMCDNSKEKWDWMSMLCHAQYKFTIDRLLQTITEEQNREYTLPIPPDDYIFDHIDSPETIIFEQPNSTIPGVVPGKNINPYSSTDNLSIRAATLIKLVERLTHHSLLYPKFSPTFLMCYREFCTSHELFNLLSLRYDVPDLNLNQVLLDKYTSGGIIERELLKRYKREYQQPIRLKVINVIKHWIYGYFSDDFANDSELLQKLNDFIQRIGFANQRYQQVLANILKRKISQYRKIEQQAQLSDSMISKMESISLCSDASINSDKNFMKQSSISSSKIPVTSSRSSSTSTADESLISTNTTINSKLTNPSLGDSIDQSDSFLYDDTPYFEIHLENSYPFDILTIHPLEFARQATLMESELFKAIKPSELISLGWNKPDQRYKLSPNLTKLINLSNKFTYWYAKCIVDTLNLEERVAVVLRILDIAEYFYEMNNFSGLKEIYAAFETSSVIRLEVTREKSAVEDHKMYARFKELFDNHDRGYLERIKKCNPPCVPFIGSHLTIILKTQEYNKLNDENHKLKIIMQQEQLKAEEALTNDSTISSKTKDLASVFSITAKTHLINFSKYRLLVEFVTDLLQYQNMSYKLRIHDKIRSFIFEDIENYFRTAQSALESKEEELNSTDSGSVDMINMTRPEMVEAWLFARSKQIEPKEVFHYPRIKNYSLKPPTERVNNKLNHSKNNHSQTNLNGMSRKSDSIKGANKSSNSERTKHHSNSLSTSRQSQQALITSLSLTIPSSISNQNDACQLSPIEKSPKQPKNNNHKRSNSSLHQLRLPDQSNINNIPSLSPSPSPSPTFSKYTQKFNQLTANSTLINKLFNNSNNNPSLMSSSSSSIANLGAITTSSTALTLASSSASAMSSSQMFPTSVNVSNTSQLYGSYYSPSPSTIANTSLSSSPPHSTSQIANNFQNQSNYVSSTNILEQQSSRTNGSLHSSSSANGALTSACFAGSHDPEKLSLSSADSSSSFPNSPPPNYDEVFDSSNVANTFDFITSNTLCTNNNNNTIKNSSSTNNTDNCYDNKTYFRRLDQNLSTSLNNLNNDENQGVQQFLKPYKDGSIRHNLLKPKINQLSVFSFPDFNEQNEDINMSSRNNSTDILSTSSSMQSSPLLPQEEFLLGKKNVQHAFNFNAPPPNCPPPPPPVNPPAIPAYSANMQTKSNIIQTSASQISLNSLHSQPPPSYPPPLPETCGAIDVLSRLPPPIPARPPRNDINKQ